MKQTKFVSIGDCSYELAQMPAIKSFKTLTRLLKLLGGPLGTAANGSSSSIMDMEMAEVFGPLFENIDTPEAHELCLSMLEYAYLEGKPVKSIADVHFAGKIGDMMELIAAQLKFQFEDVFQKLGSVFQGQLPGQSIKPQSMFSGQSGESFSQKSQRSKK